MKRDIASFRVGRAAIWLTLFHYYTAISGFLAYCFVALKRPKISSVDLLFLCGLLLLLALQFIVKTPFQLAYDFRYHWGWVFFYLIFKGNTPNQNALNRIFVWLCVLTLAEAILVNTVLTVQMLPNFVAKSSNIVSPGIYQRPFSFAGMPQVGAPLLVTLMALCNVQGWRLWLSMLAVLSLASGTGFLTLALLLLIRHRTFIIKTAVPIFLCLILILLTSHKEFQTAINIFTTKINFGYFVYLADLLWKNIVNTYATGESYMFFIGYPDAIGHGGDWGVLTFLQHNGICGLLLLLLFVLLRINQSNRLPLLIILGSSVHYAAMSFFPGQMILGLLLSISKGGLPGEPRHAIKASSGKPDSSVVSNK